MYYVLGCLNHNLIYVTYEVFLTVMISKHQLYNLDLLIIKFKSIVFSAQCLRISPEKDILAEEPCPISVYRNLLDKQPYSKIPTNHVVLKRLHYET